MTSYYTRLKNPGSASVIEDHRITAAKKPFLTIFLFKKCLITEPQREVPSGR
jgi:hypothetical protein